MGNEVILRDIRSGLTGRRLSAAAGSAVQGLRIWGSRS